jgi:hypothetical protein
MKIKELREFFNNIPESMDDFQIIYRKFEDDEENVLFFDYPLIILYFDEENEESVFLDEDGWDYFSKNLLLNDDDESNESNE